jgi:hypothetical protein
MTYFEQDWNSRLFAYDSTSKSARITSRELCTGVTKRADQNIQQIIKGEPKIINDLSKVLKFEGSLLL